MGTSYRPISLLSVIAKTLKKCLLPYITANLPIKPTQHGYKIQHSTVTALHTLNNTIAKGFNQMAPPPRTITVALMSYADDIIIMSTHTSTSGAKTYQPYLDKVLVWPNITTYTSIQTKPPALYSPKPCIIQCKSGVKNKTTHGNTSKDFGSRPRPKNSHATRTFTTYQYKRTQLYK